MIFAVKIFSMIMLNASKNYGFTFFLENITLEKPIGGEVKLTPPAFLG